MLNWLRNVLLVRLITTILDEIITTENYHDVADSVLDMLENLAAKTTNTLDDAAVAKVREILKIPDGDD